MDQGDWELLIEEVEARLFWGADWEMGDVFLGQPLEQARADMALHGIDPDYFLAVSTDPTDAQLAEVRQTMAILTGRGAPPHPKNRRPDPSPR
jgi:hypothetical protein